MKKHNIQIHYQDDSLRFVSESCIRCCNVDHQPSITHMQQQYHDYNVSDPIKMAFVSASAINRLSRRRGYQVNVISMRDIEKALAPKVITDPATKLPQQYHEYLDVFSKYLADHLPEHRPYDHKIK